MSAILVIGDGPLASEVAGLAQTAGHTTLTYLFNQHGPEQTPLAHLADFLRETADSLDLTIEAVVGSRSIKQQTLASLTSAFVGAEEPVLSATLNASLAEAAQWTTHPANVIGWAALPPQAGSETIEITASLLTNPAMISRAQQFISSLRREPVQVGDGVGGVLPRIVANLVNEAAFALMEDVASAEDIDQAMQLGTNYPHGPLAWGDLIGLDQIAGVMTALGEAYGPDRYRPAPLLQRFVQSGQWGVRTGQGFYSYPAEQE